MKTVFNEFQGLVDRLSITDVNDCPELTAYPSETIEAALLLMQSNKDSDDLNLIACAGLLTSAFFEFLNLNFLKQERFVLNAHLIPAIVNEISGKQLRTIPAPAPVDGYDQWIASAKSSLAISTSRRIDLTEQAQDELAAAPADLSIHQRHRLELWACGLMPDDLIQLVDPSHLHDGRLLVLPQFELRVNNDVQRQLLITRLPHLWWANAWSLPEAIRAHLEHAFISYGNPTDSVIVRCIFDAVTQCINEGSAAMEGSNPETVDPGKDYMQFFIVDNGNGVKVGCPGIQELEQQFNEQQARLASELEKPAEPETALDPQSLRPHGAGLAAAEERQAELLGDAVPPTLHVDHPSSGAGVAAAKERQDQAIHEHGGDCQKEG